MELLFKLFLIQQTIFLFVYVLFFYLNKKEARKLREELNLVNGVRDKISRIDGILTELLRDKWDKDTK